MRYLGRQLRRAVGPTLVVSSLLFALGCTDTRYAPGYSEEQWDALEVGDSADRVEELLGPPLRRRPYHRDRTWVYGPTDTCRSHSGRAPRIVFDEEGVGRDVNRVVDTPEEGLTERQVESALGEPRARCTAVHGEGWLYSESPSSTDYDYREVLVEDGRVVEIDAHSYFD